MAVTRQLLANATAAVIIYTVIISTVIISIVIISTVITPYQFLFHLIREHTVIRELLEEGE